MIAVQYGQSTYINCLHVRIAACLMQYLDWFRRVQRKQIDLSVITSAGNKVIILCKGAILYTSLLCWDRVGAERRRAWKLIQIITFGKVFDEQQSPL